MEINQNKVVAITYTLIVDGKEADKATVEGELSKLKDAVKDMTPDTMTEADTESVKAATESLKQEFYKLSEKLYAQAQAAQGGEAGPDVVDVDGTEI